MNKLQEYTVCQLEALKEKRSYVMKQDVIRDYHTLLKEIKDKEKKFAKYIEEYDLENAQVLSKELEGLNSRKNIIQPTYDRMVSVPYYQDEDLYVIYANLKDMVKTDTDELYAKIKESEIQIRELRKQIEAIYDMANFCRREILSRSDNKKKTKVQLKFHDFPTKATYNN